MNQPDLAMLIAVILFVIGFLGSFLPVLPGNAIVWLGIFIHKMMLGDASVSWTFFWIATVLAIAAQVLDYLCAYWGARRFGASWQGALGGVIGGILGAIFFNIPGLILGPIIGVLAVELVRSRNLRQAGRAGIGTVVGGFAAFIGKLFLTVIMISGFFLSLYDWF